MTLSMPSMEGADLHADRLAHGRSTLATGFADLRKHTRDCYNNDVAGLLVRLQIIKETFDADGRSERVVHSNACVLMLVVMVVVLVAAPLKPWLLEHVRRRRRVKWHA